MAQSSNTFDQNEPALLIDNNPIPIKYLQYAGATSGQVPTYNGTTVVWGSPGGFTLPTSETDSTTTTGDSVLFTESTLTTGNGIRVLGTTGTFTTGGALFKADLSAATAGNGFVGVTTGVYTGTGLLLLTANSATTGTIGSITANGLTSGIGFSITSSATAITGAGRLLYINHTGVTGTSAILNEFASAATDETIVHKVTASGAITGTVSQVGATATVTGLGHQVIAAAATLTIGRYYSANDGALEVFGVGANGHLHTAQTTAPTIVVTTQNGITAAAITAGASDTCGIITTTGTNNAGGATVLDVTFNKTYTTAPKSVILTPRNAAAAKAAATSLALPFISATSATGFTITIPSDASAGATPSYAFLVVA